MRSTTAWLFCVMERNRRFGLDDRKRWRDVSYRALAELENLRGISPNVHLHCELWGHINHEDINCGCQSSDRMAAYVHDLTVNGRGCVPSPDAGVASSCYTRNNRSMH